MGLWTVLAGAFKLRAFAFVGLLRAPYSCGTLALLIDLDGTLIDSEPWHKRSEIETFARWGVRLSEEDLLPFTGTTLPYMLERIEERFGILIEPDEFMEAQMPVFRGYIEREVGLFPDAERFVMRLKSRTAAIVTSAMPWYVEAVFARHPILRDSFSVVVDQGDIENGKPDPEPFLVAASRLGRRPSDCLAVEDSVNGVRSARAAGCRVTGVDREEHGRLAEADEVVSSLDEIRDLG